MIKTITVKWLQEQNACQEGINWFTSQKRKSPISVVKALIADAELGYAGWLLPRLMTHKQAVQYAVFAAKMVLKYYEDKHPNDLRPRKAIEAAEAFIADPSEENKNAAHAAANATAYAASNAASNAASHAAYAAAHAASVVNAAYAAADATSNATKEGTRFEICAYGLKLLGGKVK